MSLHHDRLRAQHGYPLHRDHTEHLETGIASAVHEIDELRTERDRLLATVASIREYAQLLRALAASTRDAGGDYLAHTYREIATALESKIGDRT